MYQNINQNKFGLKKIIKTAWDIYKNKLRTILLIVLLFYFPIYSLVFAMKQSFSNMEKLYIDTLNGLLEIIFSVIVVMGITYVVKEYINENSIDFISAIKKAFSNWGKALWTEILSFIIIILLMMLLIIPGVIWMVYYTFIIQLVALRNKSGKKILDFSKDLVKGDWWRVTEIVFIRFFVNIGLTSLISYFPKNALINILANTFINIIDGYFLVATAVMCLNLYYIKYDIDKV